MIGGVVGRGGDNGESRRGTLSAPGVIELMKAVLEDTATTLPEVKRTPAKTEKLREF